MAFQTFVEMSLTGLAAFDLIQLHAGLPCLPPLQEIAQPKTGDESAVFGTTASKDGRCYSPPRS